MPGVHRSAPEVELGEQLQKANAQLVALQRQQQQLEEQKRLLEEMTNRQKEVEHGRRDMSDRLRRAVVLLEREEEASRRDAEEINRTRESFLQALNSVEQIQPEQWDPDDLEASLSESLSRIDHAKAVYHQNSAKLQVLKAALTHGEAEEEDLQEDGSEIPRGNFLALAQRGLAFHLPLIVLGLIWLLVFWFKTS